MAARTRLHSLTSLRWFAASAVFLGHGDVIVDDTRLESSYRNLSVQGATGVSFFFILSGFVLAWAFRPDDTVHAFYRRRVARIVPAYLVAWALSWFVFLGLDHITDAASLGKGVLGATLLQAWVPDERTYLGTNGVAWSLSVEAFFYALFPVLIIVLRRLDRRWLTLTMVSAAAISLAIPLLLRPDATDDLGQWAIYINPTYRLFEFVVGLCLCGLLLRGVRLRIPAAAAMTLAVAAYLAAAHVPRYALLVTVTLVPFALLIFVCAQADLEGRATGLGHPALVRLGEWSFSFYLLHQLVARVVARAADPADPLARTVALVLLAYALSIGCAYVLYRYVEHPLERRIRHGGTSTSAREGRASADLRH